MVNKRSYINWQEIKYVHNIWSQLNLELKELEKLLITRRKRVLLSLGCSTLNILFGTATSAELKTLHQVDEGIRKQQNVMTHSVENQLTYTKELDGNVRQNS
jgi:hypothetical protein